MADMAEQLAGFLNGLLEVDRDVVADLVGRRAPCNRRMAEHPFVQVLAPGGAEGPFSVGLLGVLNGFLLSRAKRLAVAPPGGPEQFRLVVAEFGPAGELERFRAAPTATVRLKRADGHRGGST